MGENKIYSLFIAYHGSNSSTGTEQLAFSMQSFVETTLACPSCYCGPATDEHTFTEHMTEVIPNSRLFLLVVNDDAPKDDLGHLNSNISKYLYEELKSFYELVKLKRRSKKDFGVYYVGNLRKTPEERINYIKTLLGEIDPEGMLFEGNQYYFIDYRNIGRWIKERENSTNTNIELVDYYPYQELQKRVENFLIDNASGQFLIKAERGMGKTTFIKNLQRFFETDSKIKNALVFDFYISREHNYSHLPDFSQELTLKVKENSQSDNSSIPLLEVDTDNLCVSFINFINYVKRNLYYDKKLIIAIDAVDNIRNESGKTILEYFHDLSKLADNIYLIFTSSVNNSNDMESQTSAEIMRFENRFPDSNRLTLKTNDIININFLENYYKDRILSQYSVSLTAEEKKSLFDKVPNNILSFSILYKITKTFFDNNKGEKNIINSLDNAFAYYYDYIKKVTDSETLKYVKRLLCLLSLSNNYLTDYDLVFLLGGDKYLTIAEKHDFNYAFINYYNFHGETRYQIVHPTIKEMILKENQDLEKDLINEISFRLQVTLNSNEKLNEIFKSSFAPFLFLEKIFDSKYITSDDKNRLAEQICHLPFDFTWTKSTRFVKNESYVINTLLDAEKKRIVTLPPNYKAKLVGVLAMDYHLSSYFKEASDKFIESKQLYESISRDFIADDLFNYAEMLSILSTQRLLEERNKEGKDLFKVCMNIYEDLLKKRYITTAKYLSNLISYANVLNANHNLLEQHLALIKADRILGKDSKEYRLVGFVYNSYYLFYKAKNKLEKAFDYLNQSIIYYGKALEVAPKTIYVGDIFKANIDKLDLAINLKFSNVELENTIHIVKDKIKKLKRTQSFFNVNSELYYCVNMAKAYVATNESDKAVEYAQIAKRMIDIHYPLSKEQYEINSNYLKMCNQIIENNGGKRL